MQTLKWMWKKKVKNSWLSTHTNVCFVIIEQPFGVNTTPTIFQQIMDTTLAGFDFAVAFLDDILV